MNTQHYNPLTIITLRHQHHRTYIDSFLLRFITVTQTCNSLGEKALKALAVMRKLYSPRRGRHGNLYQPVVVSLFLHITFE